MHQFQMVERYKLIRTMSQVNDSFQAARQEINDEHPNFDQIKDSRITVFTNCIVALDGAHC